MGKEMFILLEGKVRISQQVPGMGEEALAILEKGQYFGEMSVIEDIPRSADAFAHTACTLWVIEREQLDQLMFTDKDLAYVLLWSFVRTLSVRLRESNEKMKTFLALSRF
ncbi:cyclic nucleotide-binding domain-containing protein [Cystobacter fuscus]